MVTCCLCARRTRQRCHAAASSRAQRSAEQPACLQGATSVCGSGSGGSEEERREELISACAASLGLPLPTPGSGGAGQRDGRAASAGPQALLIFNLFALEAFHLAETLAIPCLAASPCLAPYAPPAGFERRFRLAHLGLYERLRAADERRAAGTGKGRAVGGSLLVLGSVPVVRSAGTCAHQATPLPASAGSTSGTCGSVGWSDVRHWLWPLFTERWGPWRSHRLGLPEAPYLDCPPGADLPAPPDLLYGKWASAFEVPHQAGRGAQACPLGHFSRQTVYNNRGSGHGQSLQVPSLR